MRRTRLGLLHPILPCDPPQRLTQIGFVELVADLSSGSLNELKRALSDIAGQDVPFHRDDYELVIKRVREFFRVEAGIAAPGPAKLISDYVTFQAGCSRRKVFEGHSEDQARDLPTRERLDEMQEWVRLGRPVVFRPK